MTFSQKKFLMKKTTSQESPWKFNGEEFTSDDIENHVGFVYLIECSVTGHKYIGKKTFYFLRKSKLKKHRNRKTRVRTESDWKKYWGSSKQLLDLIEKHGKKNFTRTILSLHSTQGDVNYCEVKEQFVRNVLEDDTYLNDNINGKWHRKPKHIVEARVLNEDIYDDYYSL